MKNLFKKSRLLALLLAVMMVTAACAGTIDETLGTDSSAASIETTVSTTETTAATESAQTSDTAAETTDAVTTDTESDTESQSYYNPENLCTSAIDLSLIPAYSDTPYAVVNDNKPFFTEAEITAVGFESYAALDALGRCGAAIACCGKEIMPAPGEERGSISSVKPTGWIQAQYICVSGQALYNRCHLIAWQLSAENANTKNLISGTRYMNADGMIPFENMVADYIKETGNHVMYRVTPIFEGTNLLASGVQLEAYSVEDGGEGVCFNVYCYNVQPFIVINYATGSSYFDEAAFEAAKPDPDEIGFYILNKNTKKIHYPTCNSVTQMSDKNRQEYTGTLNDLKAQGYVTCGNCFAGQ